MGAFLHFPHPVVYEPAPDLTFYDEHPVMERADLKTLFKTKPGETTLAGVLRKPFVGEVKTFESPIDPQYTFDVARCGVRENLQRKDMSSTVRYIDEEGNGGRSIMERDLPQGELQFKTMMLAFKGWNLADEAGASIPLNEVTVKQYLDPKEIDFLYEKALEMNPAWRPGGEAEVKKD